MEEQKIVQECIWEIFKLNGYTDKGEMTQRNFEHIGLEIETKTGILISGTTIKRLANGEFSRLPQIATLNAISNYLNYKNWQEYKSARLTQRDQSMAETIGQPAGVQKKSSRRKILWILILVGVAVIVAVFYFSSNFSGSGVSGGETASFSFSKNTQNEIPNTVVFSYNIDKVIADSFFIQQSWDDNRRIKIYKNRYTVTDIYYEPGYHVAKLIANDSVIKTVDVHIPTNGWFFLANEAKVLYKTEYIKTDHYSSGGIMMLKPEDLASNHVSNEAEKMYIYCNFPTKLKASSDNFLLKTRVRMKDIRNDYCSYLAIEVYTQRGVILMKSTDKGCANHAFLQFGERRFPGNENDLSGIAYNIRDWAEIELSIKNKEVLVKINGETAFTTRFTMDTEAITGLGFLSNGICEVDQVLLEGLNGEKVIEEDFGENEVEN